ncbi:hypothetical protein BH11VER1_BH11VER1_34810 [soil metagenome]
MFDALVNFKAMPDEEPQDSEDKLRAAGSPFDGCGGSCSVLAFMMIGLFFVILAIIFSTCGHGYGH